MKLRGVLYRKIKQYRAKRKREKAIYKKEYEKRYQRERAKYLREKARLLLLAHCLKCFKQSQMLQTVTKATTQEKKEKTKNQKKNNKKKVFQDERDYYRNLRSALT